MELARKSELYYSFVLQIFCFKMNRLLFVLATVVVMTACQQNAASLVELKSNLNEYSATPLVWGDAVSIEVSGDDYDSLQFSVNGKVQDNFQMMLTERNSVLGKNTLRLKAFRGGKSTEREVEIVILSDSEPVLKEYEIIDSYLHNPEYFTEGLVYSDGLMYEGTGLNGKSKLVIYELSTGELKKSVALRAEFFGEGISQVGNRIFQLTYKAQKCFVYDVNSLERVGEYDFKFSAEGWGLCSDGEKLIMSNGSHYLYFIDPENFSYTGSLQVADNKGIRGDLNELEFYDGRIYANVWYQKEILVINAVTGEVEKIISLDRIPEEEFQKGVANGIAIKDGNLLVTGKNWGRIYELQSVTN